MRDGFEMAVIKWHKGKPPSVGWYWCVAQNLGWDWRWWNGSVWSDPVPQKTVSPWQVNQLASFLSDLDVNTIWWSDYWPEGARVPDTRGLK